MNQPLAYVHPGAKIAKNVVIEPFTTINNNVVIGEGTWVGSNVIIMEGARIGKNCSIFPGSVISAIPQDLKFKGEDSLVVIKDNTTIRECVTINRGTSDRGETTIGKNCLIMAYCHVAHDCIIGDNVVIANLVQLAGHVLVGNWVIIEGTAAIQQFVSIGEHSFIAGGSLVRKNVPPYVKAAREPLSYIGVNTIGLRRRGFNDQQIINIEDIYRVIYVQNSNITTALRVAELEIPISDEKEVVLEFIRNSTKGIMRGLS